jgi:hypothetical protein
MASVVPPMISTAYDQLAKPSVSLSKMVSPPSSRPKTQWRKIDGGFGARAADVARVCDSEMAPQAVGIAQNGLGNGGARSQSPGGRTN